MRFYTTTANEGQSDYSLLNYKPMLAWNLNCAAVRMSQSLGFHKACIQDPERSVATRRKARLFVILYVADKMLSLRLGRGSMIRDEEVPLDYKVMLNGVNTAPYKYVPYWVGFARIQGLVYDRLYSPKALQCSQENRHAQAMELLNEMDTLVSEKCEIKVRFPVVLCDQIRWIQCPEYFNDNSRTNLKETSAR